MSTLQCFYGIVRSTNFQNTTHIIYALTQPTRYINTHNDNGIMIVSVYTTN